MIKYKNHVYDTSINYLGPQDHWLNTALERILDTQSSELQEQINQVAFVHDCDYAGERRQGFIGLLIDAYYRYKADRLFFKWIA